MYEYLKGQFIKSTPSTVILEVQGVGYRVFFSPSQLHRLPSGGQELLLYIAAIYREAEQTLYGFMTQQERDFFEMLLTISGIGPKTALAILSSLSPVDMQNAVMRNSISDLCKVPGIGKKTAERMLIDLRDKLPLLMTHSIPENTLSSPFDPKKLKIQDAMSALVNLGYSQAIAQKAIQKSLKEIDEESDFDLTLLITHSLRNV